MGYFNEFPHTRTYESDLGFLIHKYKEWKGKTDILEKNLLELTDEFKKFVETLNVDDSVRKYIDEMYSDGRLLALISTSLFDIEIKFFGGSTDNPLGSNMVAIDRDGYAIIFDVGYKPTEFIQTLKTNGITKVKALIISHFHADHVGVGGSGVTSLLSDNDIDTSKCVVYFPHANLNWTQFIDYQNDPQITTLSSVIDTITTYCNQNNVQIYYPYENEVVHFHSIDIQFNNLSLNKFVYYYSFDFNGTGTKTNYTTYNNFSMISTIIHCGHRIVYCGDIQKPAQRQNFILFNGVECATSPHHATNRQADKLFIDSFRPQYLIIPTGENYWSGERLTQPDTIACIASNAKVAITAEAEIVTIVSGYGGIEMKVKGQMYTSSSLDKQQNCGIPITQYNELNVYGLDLNDYVIPGTYYVQNSAINNLVTNSPFGATTSSGGFKLLVEYTSQASPNRALTQLAYYQSSLSRMHAIRTRSTDGTWSKWRYSGYSDYLNHTITNSNCNGCNISSGATADRMRFKVQNGVCSVCFDVTTTTAITSSTHFIQIPRNNLSIGLANYFLVRNVTDGTILQASVSYDQDYFYLYMGSSVASGKRLVGMSCYCIDIYD